MTCTNWRMPPWPSSFTPSCLRTKLPPPSRTGASPAGRAFAMGQAPDEVKTRATDVLSETSETGGGVAAAVEKAFGIVTRPRG